MNVCDKASADDRNLCSLHDEKMNAKIKNYRGIQFETFNGNTILVGCANDKLSGERQV